MKKIVFLAAALMASMFILTSCEKENVAEMAENSVKKAPNFVLMQKGYVDENGYVGDLFADENNPTNRYCVIYKQQPQTRAHQQPKPFDGKLYKKYTPEGYEEGYECKGDPTNCWNNPNGVSFPSDAKPIIIREKANTGK